MPVLTTSAGDQRFLQFVPRLIAVLALLAVFVGRSLAPALWGARAGLDRVIPTVDVAGGVVTYLFAFAGMAATLAVALRAYRERKLGTFFRYATLACSGPLLVAVGPACYRPLPVVGNILIAAASGTLALLAAHQTGRVPHTRALGVLLLTAGAAAWMHVVASALAWQAGELALYGLAVFARVLATASVVFDGLTVFTAFAWLMTRQRNEARWLAQVAVFLACVLAWSVARGPTEGAGLWTVVAERFVARQLTSPPPYVWQPLRYVLEASAPLLAGVALLVRRQVPALSGSIALLLLARPATDVPLAAVALTLAALFGALAAHDDRSLWAVLLRDEARSPVSPSSRVARSPLT